MNDKNRSTYRGASGLVLPWIALAFLSACSTLGTDPFRDEAEAGIQTPRPLRTTAADLGFYEYLPASYADAPTRSYPLLVFFHGSGEAGNGVGDLPLVLRNGPPRLIQDGRWLTATKAPFIVVSPQSADAFPSPDAVHGFIEAMTQRYRVDPSRIYITGISAGAFTIWSYLAEYQDQAAAAVPIAGRGNVGSACAFEGVPVWAFHGDSDSTVAVSGSIAMVDAINACSPRSEERAHLTLFEGVGHDSWSRTYDLSGMNAAEVDPARDAYGVSVYDWLLRHAR